MNWDVYKSMTEEQINKLKEECETTKAWSTKFAIGGTVACVISGIAALYFANTAANCDLVRHDIEAFEETEKLDLFSHKDM